MQPSDFLRQTPPFDQLDEATIQQIVATLKIVRYPAKTPILEAGGEPSHFLYIVYSGSVRLERNGRTVLLLEEGDLFGFPSLLAQRPPVFDVITDEESVIYQIREPVFRDLLQRIPAFADYFLRGLGERLRRTTTIEPTAPTGLADFSTSVHTLIQRPPVFVAPQSSVAEAARTMHRHNISSVLVEHDPVGILTVRDLRSRVLAAERPPETPVHTVMSCPAITIPATATLLEALLVMIEHGIHHLPIEQAGRIIGVITDTDLLHHQLHNPLLLFERLRRAQRVDDLHTYTRDLTATVAWLFENGLDVLHIGRIVATLNDTLTTRLIALAEHELGAPPCPYAWLVFGSEGRMEQLLITDQDNALVYAETTPEHDAYFAQFAAFVVEGLMAAGFPPCKGGYMATHWRRPLDEWERLFRTLVDTPTPDALLEAGIFFDMRRVHGTLSLAPLETIIRHSGTQPRFLAHMARAAQAWQPPLGFLRRIRDEHGKVDLKRGGIAPIVALARLYALEAQSPARATVERLHDAIARGILSEEGGETLQEAFRFLMRLRLRAQLDAVRAHQHPDNAITLASLSSLERRMLKETFLAIRDMQEAVGLRYQTDLLG
ncbi:MAG: cyclic nucleotide-binding/CBS domain-containing protein [Ardenticatenia bacterium]|nr:MAG: cyclic nucleotide-binding/CBS domain-containing protein [Ardenticatenia bacterium]